MATTLPRLPFVAFLAALVNAVPQGFPSSGNGLWYTSPGQAWATHWLPVGNGYLAAMTPGGTVQEPTQLNIESLWSGGPFQDKTYNGGNKQPSERAQMAQDMQEIRKTIFSNGTIDNLEELTTDAGAYGSYAGSGYLITTLNSSSDPEVVEYGRWLDLERGVAGATWASSEDNSTFSRTTLCSHPTRACTQHLVTNGASGSLLPTVTHAFSSSIESGLPQANVSCLDNSTLRVQGNVAEPGMAYELLFRVTARGKNARVQCHLVGGSNATISVEGASEEWITWVGDTEYDMDAGNAASNYSFAKPLSVVHTSLSKLLNSATTGTKAFKDILSAHTEAYKRNLGDLTFSFGANANLNLSSLPPTDQLVSQYKTDEGNPYLEWLIFNFGRHLLATSAPGQLPSNLQGKWAMDISPAWSADYHSNINIQMNYWFAEITGAPSHVVTPLFDYIQKTWAPRGSETALTLYNISRGFVTHNEMNIFGHTGMKAYGNSAEWADYPESAVWMMVHVWDHFDFTGDSKWWKAQGWPLLKGVAAFHLDKLIVDEYSNDTTLVVAPCNSPEQVPITFGCAHAQQLIWQLFNAVEKGWHTSGDTDTAFLEEIRTKRALMDKGIHIGSWSQLQEWKLDMDSPNDTHRHLSHLIGVYPGYALTSYNSTLQSPPAASKNVTYTRSQVLDAARTSLVHRGNGTGPDGDAGWEKVWRAAMWAQFGDAQAFYHQLTYSIERNFGPNLFSLYNPLDANPFFQIDANFGYPAALLNGLIHNPDVASNEMPYTITLLPAVPQAWSSGSLKNVHLRGGLKLDMDWEDQRPRNVQLHSGSASRNVRVTLVFGGLARNLLVKVGSTYKVTF